MLDHLFQHLAGQTKGHKAQGQTPSAPAASAVGSHEPKVIASVVITDCTTGQVTTGVRLNGDHAYRYESGSNKA